MVIGLKPGEESRNCGWMDGSDGVKMQCSALVKIDGDGQFGSWWIMNGFDFVCGIYPDFVWVNMYKDLKVVKCLIHLCTNNE